MTSTPRGLGRGLGALIPGRPQQDEAELAAGASGIAAPSTQAAPVEGAFFAEVPVTAIRPNPRQPRSVFDDDAMAELVASIRVVGLLQPVVVRAVGPSSYELIMGERRWRAVREVGLTTIPAVVKETSDDAMLRNALLENLHRAALNPLEEAAAYAQLLDDFGCTQDELAARIGRSRPHLTNTMRLLRLSPPVQRRVAAGVLSPGHARALLAVDGELEQERLAHRVVAESLSVRGLEELVRAGRPPKRRVRHRPAPTSESERIASELSERLDTRCSIVAGSRRSRLVVEFADAEDLHRISGLLGVDVPH